MRTVQATSAIQNLGFLRQPQVLQLVGFSARTLWRRCKASTFPQPVKLSARITAWRTEEVLHWIAAQGKQGKDDAHC
ncbi:AlpA family phage regulatory protein [Salmonella enterica subsp. enterica]|nr:AlpA family phage regulatory protein [Salmonella enterica subsp. enterica serovar Heidelberg]